tara:strand:- start:13 stop:537 length:525 start_codon:yes stop_codon:yes gene_type:complete
MFPYELKIPKSRVPILIGTKGEIKKYIEKKTKTKIKVSKEGEVIITSGDNINVFNAKPIILAIGRGFNPDIALTLLDENFCFEIISMPQLTRNTPKNLARVRSRLIGTRGKARVMLEKLTDTYISVQGKTVAMVGRIENVAIAKRAITKLLQGTEHGKVYAYIDRQKHNFFSRT